MSYRAKGETDGELIRQAEQDIRYLYKCCEGVDQFMVGAAINFPFSFDGWHSTRWYSRLAVSTLYGAIMSVDFAPGTYTYGDPGLVMGIYVNEVLVGEVTIAPGDNLGIATINPTVQLGLTDYLTFRVRDGGGSSCFVAALLEGPAAASAGLEFRFVKGGGEG